MLKSAITSLVCACLVLTSSWTCAREEGTVVLDDQSVAVYGPGIYPAIEQLARCGEYRVLVVYVKGTDMLFLDRLVPANNESTYAAEDGMSFKEFNHFEDSNEIETVSCKLLAPRNLLILGRAWSAHANEDFKFSIVVDSDKRSYKYEDTQAKK